MQTLATPSFLAFSQPARNSASVIVGCKRARSISLASEAGMIKLAGVRRWFLHFIRVAPHRQVSVRARLPLRHFPHHGQEAAALYDVDDRAAAGPAHEADAANRVVGTVNGKRVFAYKTPVVVQAAGAP